MAQDLFSIGWDVESLAKLKWLEELMIVLDPAVQEALKQAAQILIDAARGNMDWQNPTGALSESIQQVEDDPLQLEVGSDLPYARRREFGFEGMTDSLGRTYSNDYGAFFLTYALEDHADECALIVLEAMEAVIVAGAA